MAIDDIRSLFDGLVDRDNQGCHIYEPSDTKNPTWLSYGDLQALAKRNACRLRQLDTFKPASVILVHFDTHRDNIIWFWSVVYAGCVPCMSIPFVKNEEGRAAHILHLFDLLEDPNCLTRKSLLARDFNNCKLRVTAVEDLDTDEVPEDDDNNENLPATRPDNLAVLMLTSGSTGNAKAVCLTHRNLLASVASKQSVTPTGQDTTYFNFIGIDHVAALVETHFLALCTGNSQVHVQAADMIAEPLEFLRLMHEHRVSRTFAPNFFLANLRRAIGAKINELATEHLDLSCLRYIVSGGEANPLETVDTLSKMLHRLGAAANCIRPAWGMSETCAGSIYNPMDPENVPDLKGEFASVGKCVPGIKLRIKPLGNHAHDSNNTSAAAANNDANEHANGYIDTDKVDVKSRRDSFTEALPAAQAIPPLASIDRSDELYANDPDDTSNKNGGPGAVGELEVKGDVLFQRYYNNPHATKAAFSNDGWFNTQDLATIDSAGYLHLVGRTKDLMTINGVKYLPTEIESAIDEADIPGIVPTYTACFARRHAGAETEHVCVVYLPSYSSEDAAARVAALDSITKLVLLITSSKPYVLPLDSTVLQKTTLGKILRNQIKRHLEEGKFADLERMDQEAVSSFRQTSYSPPTSDVERRVLRVFQNYLDLQDGELGVETTYFKTGLTSLGLIQLKRRLEQEFDLPEPIPMITLMTEPNIRALANAISSLSSAEVRPYNPIVTFNATGPKTPLFLIHPGVGEILVFMGLIKYLDDRPVHAIRARGFNKGEAVFGSLTEILETYYSAVRQTQPHGPYALAGYSWGSMVAFELAKRLEADGEPVAFVGAFNLPPNIKWRMRELDWVECLVHLAYFSQLIPEGSTHTISSDMRVLPSKQAQLDHLISVSDRERFEELALSPAALINWAEVAFSMQSSAIDYEPSGFVSKLDVFYCEPLKALGLTKEEWREQHLSAWEEFAGDVRFHEAEGAHYTMLLPEFVGGFQRSLKRVLKMRGI